MLCFIIFTEYHHSAITPPPFSPHNLATTLLIPSLFCMWGVQKTKTSSFTCAFHRAGKIYNKKIRDSSDTSKIRFSLLSHW